MFLSRDKKKRIFNKIYFIHLFHWPLSVHLRGVQGGLLVHGLDPIDQSLENVGYVFQRAHIQNGKNVRVLVIVRAHQGQGIVQEVTPRRHHALARRQ